MLEGHGDAQRDRGHVFLPCAWSLTLHGPQNTTKNDATKHLLSSAFDYSSPPESIVPPPQKKAAEKFKQKPTSWKVDFIDFFHWFFWFVFFFFAGLPMVESSQNKLLKGHESHQWIPHSWFNLQNAASPNSLTLGVNTPTHALWRDDHVPRSTCKYAQLH